MSKPPKRREEYRAIQGDSAAKPVSLKTLAQHLRLSTATISAVINDSPAARSIPQETRDRIFRAVAKFNYRPNFFARSLRQKRSFTVAVIVPEISEGYGATLMAGIEDRLLQEGYLYFVASHRNQQRLLEEYPRLLMDRAVEGFILVNTPLRHPLGVPAVAIAPQTRIKGVTNIIIDNHQACWLALQHLANLGHKDIAFFKGHPGSGDTESRWLAVCSAAQSLGIAVRPELTVQLKGIRGGPEPSTPEEGYAYAQKLLSSRQRFTAFFAFNDISAIGAMSAFRDAGFRIPEDISVIGFDDITAASFQNPRLTTVRQPLKHMGELAAVTLLQRIAKPETAQDDISVAPELVVRESTCAVADSARGATAATGLAQ